MYHRQCLLGCGARRYVAWIPERFARVGKRIRIDRHGAWRVREVGVRLPSELVVERSQDYKHQRRASDI